MNSYEILLLNLNNEISSLPEDDKRRIELVEKYNNELCELLSVLKKPLPEECELDSKLILDEYKVFKDNFEKSGYYTFKKYLLKIDIIAEVRIKKVKKRGAVVQAEVINLYKGHISHKFTFNVFLSWKPDKWFNEKELCLVFLTKGNSGDYFASSLKSRMPIINENKELYVLSYNCEPEFWGYAETIVVKSTEWEYLTKVRYENVIKQIQESC